MNNIFVNDARTDLHINNPSKVRAAGYCRLSKDDGDYDGDSSSIQTQRAMLEHYCLQQGWEVVAVYQDDGYTGLNMNRPDLQRLLKAVEHKQIDVIVTKDLSRLSRNYLEVGQLMEETFPRNSVRYIAINDAVDSNQDGAYDMTPFRAVMNQMYSADVSKKVHSAYVTKARSGQFTGCLAPFGYKKSPDNHNQLVPDEDTAWIVKAIFDYAKEGKGPNAIRRKLEDAKVPTPTWWNRQKGLRDKTTKFERENPETGHFIWDFTTIKEILGNPVYIGAIASQKTVYKFKTGWIKDKKPYEWMIVEDTHEPIVSRETFEMVQGKVKSRQRPDAFGNYSIFAGLLKCGECGYPMTVRETNAKTPERIYTCSRYNKFGAKHCSQHKIKYDVLYDIILEQIRSYAAKALEDENEVLNQLAKQSKNDYSDEHSLAEKNMADDTARLATLDKVIAKLYEDMVAERINLDNFNSILAKSQSEQKALRDRLQLSKSRLDNNRQEQDDTSRWIELIKEYANIQELDSATLQRLIKKIVIHEGADGGMIRQTIEIHFNFLGQTDKYKLIRE